MAYRVLLIPDRSVPVHESSSGRLQLKRMVAPNRKDKVQPAHTHHTAPPSRHTYKTPLI
jgi:hypothetical protein